MASRSPENACNPPRDSLQRIVVLGIGNMLWADEGFGVRCVEALQQRFEFAPHVELVDGGTQGLALLQYVQEADALLILEWHQRQSQTISAGDVCLRPATNNKTETSNEQNV